MEGVEEGLREALEKEEVELGASMQKGWRVSGRPRAVAQAESGVAPCLEGCCPSSEDGLSPRPDLRSCCCCWLQEEREGLL